MAVVGGAGDSVEAVGVTLRCKRPPQLVLQVMTRAETECYDEDDFTDLNVHLSPVAVDDVNVGDVTPTLGEFTASLKPLTCAKGASDI